MSASFEKFSWISFLTYRRKANFVAYIPFFVIEKQIDKILQCNYFSESLLCAKSISLEDNDTGNLETAISVLIWISTDQFNNLHVKQAAQAMKSQTSRLIHLQQCGLQSSLFILSSFSSATLKLDNISVVCDTALIKQSTKTCFYTVTPLWRPLDSTLTILKPTRRGVARSALRDTRNQRGFVGSLSTVATTTSSSSSSVLADFLLYTFDHKLRC